MLEAPTAGDIRDRLLSDKRLPINLDRPGPFAVRQRGFIQQANDTTGAIEVCDEPASLEEYAATSLVSAVERQIAATLAEAKYRPTNPYALTNAANVLSNAGRVAEAERFYIEAIRLAPGLQAPALGLARIYVLTGRVDEASAIYERLAAETQDAPMVLSSLAQLKIQRMEWSEAEALLNRVILKDPENATAYNNRGIIRALQGKLRDAINDLRHALKINVRNVVTHNALGVCYMLAQNVKRASREFRATLTLDPDNRDAAVNLARLYVTEKRPIDAIGVLRKHDDDTASVDVGARLVLAEAYLAAGKYDESVTQLTRCLNELKGDGQRSWAAQVLNNLGVALRARGQTERAYDCLRKAISATATSPIPFRNLAGYLMDDGNISEAREIADLCLEHFPDDPTALALLGGCEALDLNPDRAVELFKRAIAADPDAVLPYAGLTMVLGEAFGRYEEAIEWAAIGLRYQPRNPALLNNLAYGNLMLGRTEQARSILDTIPQEQYEVHLTATRGLLLLREGDVMEGSRLYNLAIKAAGTRELRNLVSQKKELELARIDRERGEKVLAAKRLRKVRSLSTRQQYYRLEAERMLKELG